MNTGYSVLFYNTPYHLNRIEAGEEMGKGLFTGNNVNNLELVKHVQFEIGTAVSYLKNEQVKSISGWGGSIGAAFLWLASASVDFEHMTLMIPVVDWATIIFHEDMQEVVIKMNSSGISNNLLKRAYNSISPLYVPTRTDPDRIQILFARFDQLTPESKIIEFAEKWHITHVLGYDESHASILINKRIYEDNRLFLDRMSPE